ncbi:MAG: 5'(3')-deoxyribonucleotidase [Neolewinella sp.]|jgi:5'(3')-deoxyribonucleotidase
MRIIVDMDEVLADTYHKLEERYASEFGRRATAEELNGKKVYDLPGAKHLRDTLYEPGFFRDLPVMDNAVEVMEQLYAKHEVFIVTSSTEFKYSMLDKWEWLEEHFPFIDHRRMVFCGSKTIVYGDYMIDDKASNLRPFNGTGLLFTAPHNVEEDNFDRVDNWLEVGGYFEQIEGQEW